MSRLSLVCLAFAIVAAPLASGAQPAVAAPLASGAPSAVAAPLASGAQPAVAAPLASGAQPADTTPARWELLARLGSRWITDPALDLVSETDSIFMGGVVAGYRPGGAGDRLGLELSFDSSTANATSFEMLRSRLNILSIGAALAYRLPVHPSGSLLARGGGSFDWVSVRLEDDRAPDDPALAQTAGLFSAQASVGYELAILLDQRGPPDSTAILFRADLGYAFYPSAARFDDLRRDRDEDVSPRPIASRGASLGELDPSGLLLRLGVGVRF